MGAIILVNRPLAASEAISQPIQDRFHSTTPIGDVRGLIYADQTGTLYLEESDSEGSSWSTTTTVTVSAGVTTELKWTALSKRWYRFRYVNGATAQTKFVLLQHTRGMELADVWITGSNAQIGTDLNAIWAESALINTIVNVDITLPVSLAQKYLIEIYNPSAVTALTIIAQNKALTFGGGTRYPEVTRWGVAAPGAKAVIVEGWLLDAAGRLVLSNDTALGVGQGFTANIRIIKM